MICQMAPKEKHELARTHIDRAGAGVKLDPEEAVLWAFYALEAAVDSLSEDHGIPIKEQHWARLDAAKSLADKGVIDDDVAELLDLLNEGRKNVTYSGEAIELGARSVEGAVAEVEAVVEIAEVSADEAEDVDD